MDDVARVVTEMFGPSFEDLTERLRRIHPRARFSVSSCPIGSATSYQGFLLYAECFWPDTPPNAPDHVVLEVQLCHLTSTPRVNADVCWADGSVDAELDAGWSSNEEWQEVTPQVLRRLKERMPELIEAFEEAVQRGQPK
jgi:hypothetical protein